MIKNILLIFLCIVSLSSVAQKRNFIKVIGFGYDHWSADENFTEIGDFMGSCGRFSIIAGYERLVGDRIGVGVTYNYIIPNNFHFEGYRTSYTPFKNKSAYQTLDYFFKGYTLGYESKYYFKEFELNGPDGAYIGFNYQYTSVTENIEKGIAYSGGSLPKFETSNFGVNRLGIKVGTIITDFSGKNYYTNESFLIDWGKIELAFGLFYNMPTSDKDKLWKSPIDINNISFNVSCIIGVPF